MTYIFNTILCVSIMYVFIFFAISFVEVIKYVKLITFENYNGFKRKHLFSIKNVVKRFNKKMTAWRKKSIDEEKNLLLRTLKKKTLSLRTLSRILLMRNLKRSLITVKPEDSAINGDLQELQSNSFWLFGNGI